MYFTTAPAFTFRIRRMPVQLTGPHGRVLHIRKNKEKKKKKKEFGKPRQVLPADDSISEECDRTISEL